MNNISSYNSAVKGYDRGDLERFSSRSSEQREALEVSQNQNLELSLTTKEGDSVTISAESFMDFASLSYDKNGTVSDGYNTATSSYSSREMTLASGSQFSFSVKGELSEEELDDIENLVAALDEVAYEMSTGDMDEAMEKAMGMSEGYDTVSGFEADLSFSSSYRYEKEVSEEAVYQERSGERAQGYGRALNTPNFQAVSDALRGAEDEDDGAGSLLADSSSRLLDMMLEELEKMKEESETISTRAAEPVDQLLAHHMERFQGGEVVDGDDGESNDAAGADVFLNQLSTAQEGMKKEFQRMISEMSANFIV